MIPLQIAFIKVMLLVAGTLPVGLIATSTLLATAAIVGAVGLGAAGIVAATQVGKKKKGLPPPTELPALPSPDAAKKDAENAAKIRALQAKAFGPTRLTSGAGVIDDPNLQKKQLLGA